MSMKQNELPAHGEIPSTGSSFFLAVISPNQVLLLTNLTVLILSCGIAY